MIMEFKKISNTKFQCLLYEEDLEDNNISLDDFFRNDTIKIHGLLDVVMERAQESIGVELSGGVMSLQLTPQPDHSLLLTISSGEEEFGNMLKQVGAKAAQAVSKVREQKESEGNVIKRDDKDADAVVRAVPFQTVEKDEQMQDECVLAVDVEGTPVGTEKAICLMESLQQMEQFCAASVKTWGIKNTLYQDKRNGSFYLVLERGRSSKARFGQFVNDLAEYGTFVPYTPEKAAYLAEHLQVYIAENAVNIMKRYCNP